MNYNYEEGEVLLIDKPYDWTSFDVIRKVRNAITCQKMGHAGTLDPLATGLLIICTGKFTKKISEFQEQEKEYVGELIIGQTTPSFDLETEVDSNFDISGLNSEIIKAACHQFIGYQLQVPPMHSAVKVAGRRLYKSARKGKKVEVPPRQVYIKEFIIEKIELPKVSFRVVCSKGTYIRSLVRDFGLALGAGAYMSALRRTRIGDFTVENAYQLSDFVKENLDHRKNESI